MKTKIQLTIGIVVAMLCGKNSFAQFNNGIFPDGRTNGPIRSIGIGPFTLANRPLAALHINTNAPFPTSPNFTPGEVFRTDCPAANTPVWRMLRGGFERGRFYSPGSFDFVMENAQIGGNLLFTTQGQPAPLPGMSGTVRMIITNDGQIKINSLACDNCFVMADKDGKLYTQEDKILALEARIKTLEEKINELYALAQAK